MARFNPFEEAIDFSFWEKTCMEHGSLQHFSRGDYFAQTGSLLRQVGWIVSGGFKHSLIDTEGNNKTVGFVFENSVLANYISTALGKKMPTDIIALEDSDVLVVPTAVMKERLEQDSSMNLNFCQALFEQAYNHILSYYRFSPEQRYQKLIERYPRITELVTLREIASYLNLSYRQLHRIRESVLKK